MRHRWLHKLDTRGAAGHSVCQRCGARQDWRHQLGAPSSGQCTNRWSINQPSARIGTMPQTHPSTPSATYVGGPLDGETYWKNQGGPWALYLDNDGHHLPVWRGDRVGRVPNSPGCYVLRDEDDRRIYRHSSTLPQLA